MSVADFAHKINVNRSTVYRMITGKALPEGVTSEVFVKRLIIKVDQEKFKFNG